MKTMQVTAKRITIEETPDGETIACLTLVRKRNIVKGSLKIRKHHVSDDPNADPVYDSMFMTDVREMWVYPKELGDKIDQESLVIHKGSKTTIIFKGVSLDISKGSISLDNGKTRPPKVWIVRTLFADRVRP